MADTSAEFGEQLRRAREARGLSVRAAARDAGFSEGQWRQMEKGYRQVTAAVRVPTHPKVDTVRAAARAVGLDVAMALELAGHFTAAAAAAELGRVGDVDAQHDEPPIFDVVHAIRNDPDLLPEAKEHLERQYGLLLRVQAARSPDAVRAEVTEAKVTRLRAGRQPSKKAGGNQDEPLTRKAPADRRR